MPRSRWTVAREGDRCGYNGHLIAVDAPMLEFDFGPEGNKRKRCEQHAHREVNPAEVDAARHAREIERLNASHELARSTSVLPASAVSDIPDPKARQLGEDA